MVGSGGALGLGSSEAAEATEAQEAAASDVSYIDTDLHFLLPGPTVMGAGLFSSSIRPPELGEAEEQ